MDSRGNASDSPAPKPPSSCLGFRVVIAGIGCVQAAPNKVIQNLQRAYGGLRDDTSLVVLDIMPPGVAFSQLAQSAPKQPGGGGSSGGGGGGCLCFAAS